MGDSKAGNAVFLRRRHGLRQGQRKGGLGKAKPRIGRHAARARAVDLRHHRAVHPAGRQLQAVAFKVVEAANDVAHGLCPGDGFRHFLRLPRACPMGLQGLPAARRDV